MKDTKYILLIAMLLTASGCRGLPTLQTYSQIAMRDKINAEIRVRGMQVNEKEPIVKTVISGLNAGPSIAIVDIDGLLLNDNFNGLLSEGENPVSLLAEKLRAIENESSTCAIVLRVNSPGGSVTASDIIRQELVQFKQRSQLPVIACVVDLGTGGGYYIATACDAIIAHPTSVVGGVGVIVNLYNLADTLGTGNVFSQSIRSGKKIDMGSLLREIDPESQKLLQSITDEFHARFVHLVTSSRPNVQADEESNFDGRVFTASEAKARGFIDEIGYLDNAIQRARELANVKSTNVAMYHRPSDKPHSLYSLTPNVPAQSMFPASIPGLDRSRLPRFLYLWQPDPTLEARM